MKTVETKAQPWIYVSYSTSMDSNEIGRLMGEAFEKLGQFIAQNAITPAGPPLAVYHDYAEGSMVMDVGFPVGSEDLTKATGEFISGETPSGTAVKVVHKGPYEKLRETYGQIEKQFAAEGMEMAPVAWEVYVNDPDSTPAEDLLTDIYMKVA